MSSRTTWPAARARSVDGTQEDAAQPLGDGGSVGTRLGVPRAGWIALALLSVVNIFNYFDRLLMSVVGAPVKKYFALSDKQLSMLTGLAFVIVYVTTTLFFGWLSDRRNRRNIMAGVVSLWSVMTVLGGVAQNFVQLAIARAGVGLGEGGSNPASLSIISDYFPPARRSVAIAIFQASGMIGLLGAFLLGGWVAQTHGWRAAFFIAGVPGLFAAAALYVWLKEPRRRGSQAEQGTVIPLRESLHILQSNRAYRWIILATGFSVFGNLGIMQWLPQFFIRTHHLQLKEIGWYFGPGLAVGMMAGMLAGGWLGERIGRVSVARALYLCVWANIVLAPLDWTLLYVPSVGLALVLVFWHAALSVVYAPTLTAAMQTIAGVRVRGMAAAVFNTVNGLVGQALFPLLVGVLSDLLAVRYGADSLRWALAWVIPVYLVSAAVFVKAAAVTSAAQLET